MDGILAIINREIREGAAHFGTEEEGIEAIYAEFEGAKDRYPWFVAIEVSQVLGFARATQYRRRGAYAFTAEVGVYVLPDHQDRGIGSRLYEALIPAVFDLGYHILLAGIRLPNEPSVKLHEKFRFRHVGTLPEVGFKFGKWHDVGYWALTADDFSKRERSRPTSPTK